MRRLRRRSVRLGVPPAWFGYRHVEPASLRDVVARLAAAGSAVARYETLHPARREANRLPVNVTERDRLPDERGWWGYSMRDVPGRISGETALVTVPGARVISWFDERGQFHPAVLSRDDRALNMREIKFRPGHAEALRAARADGRAPVRLDRATWVLERVFDNHSHWLTAHLPKLLLLKERDRLDDVLLPERLKPGMEASLRMLGLDPAGFRRHDPSRPLEVAELTLVATDRFRPDLLRPVRDVMAPALPGRDRNRRVYVSRGRARFRRLLNEDAIWPMLARRGFERVFMEDLSFPEQVELMRRTGILVAPHGAGLTNMMFCAERTAVVEIASLDFPNPNFYALAAAMGHDYALVAAAERGDVRPLERDLAVDPDSLAAVIDGFDARSRAGARAERA